MRKTAKIEFYCELLEIVIRESFIRPSSLLSTKIANVLKFTEIKYFCLQFSVFIPI